MTTMELSFSCRVSLTFSSSIGVHSPLLKKRCSGVTSIVVPLESSKAHIRRVIRRMTFFTFLYSYLKSFCYMSVKPINFYSILFPKGFQYLRQLWLVAILQKKKYIHYFYQVRNMYLNLQMSDMNHK